MGAFTFTMRRHLIRLTSAAFTSFRLAKFGWAPFAEPAGDEAYRTHEFTEDG